MNKNVVGANVRKLRGQLHITQEELSLRCNLTQSYINFLENGKRGYSQTSLGKIARALDVRESDLFTEKGHRNEPTVSKQFASYGTKRRRYYEELIALFDKLPDAIVDHYRILLQAEVSIRNRQ